MIAVSNHDIITERNNVYVSERGDGARERGGKERKSEGGSS